MSGYTGFSQFYDRFTGDVDYSARARYFDTVIQKYSPGANLVLDLACGTGSLSFELEKLGYDVIGVDGSYEMLGAAAEKRAAVEGSSVLFLCQDMDELDLYGTIDAAVCALDSLNHVLGEDELAEIFRRVSLFCDPGAVFVFDVNTEYKHREVLGDNSFVFDDGDALCVWQNSFDRDTLIVDMKLDFFAAEGDSGLWTRSTSEFSERAYPKELFIELAKRSGFEVKAVFDEDSFLPPRPDSERLIYVLKENQKAKNKSR